jgi:hypothetical protein
MTKALFDVANPDWPLLRRIVLARLRAEPKWRHMDKTGTGYLNYVELSPSRPMDVDTFAFQAQDVFWRLVIEGLIAPGYNASNPNFPFFHVTEHGRQALAQEECSPHDPTGYLSRLHRRVQNADPTVIAYVAESLNTYVRGSTVASMVMLGVAAERAFNLLCQSMVAALASPKEKAKLSQLLERFPMKPKLDFVHEKLREIQDGRPRPPGFPENAALMVTAIYDLMRTQRNDLGHPRELPPNVSADDALANLQIFPRYYETAEAVRVCLASHLV